MLYGPSFKDLVTCILKEIHVPAMLQRDWVLNFLASSRSGGLPIFVFVLYAVVQSIIGTVT